LGARAAAAVPLTESNATMESGPLRLHGVVRAFDRVNMLLMYLGMTVAGLVFGNIVLNVTTRKLFDAPIIWSADIAQYLMVYLTFLPTAWLLLHGRHVRMTLVIDRLHGRGRRGAIIAADLIALLYSGVLTWQSWLAAREALAGHVTFPTVSAIPEFPILVAIPICAAWLCLTALVKIVAFAGADPRLPGGEDEDLDALEGHVARTYGEIEE
jgi:TRAP-type transport system small permease protein